MFATLAGGYPRTPHPGTSFALRAAHGQLERGEMDAAGDRAAQDDLVREVIAEQLDAGLGMLTDGHVRWDDPQTAVVRHLRGFELTGRTRYLDTNTYFRQPRATAIPAWDEPVLVDDWRFARDAAEEAAAARDVSVPPVKQTLVGPYTLGRLSDPGAVGRESLTLALAEVLHMEIRALVDAGAPVVQVDEDALTLIGRDDDAERSVAAGALRRLTDGIEDVHLSLAVTMGDAQHAGARLLYDLPFHSYLFDLIAGPDNWRLIAYAPGDRGIVAGVSDARDPAPDDEAVMVWAARYAASLNGRGISRVGLAPSTSLEHLPRDRAKRKIEALAEAARKAALPADELRRQLDPRAVDARAAALGRVDR